VRIAAQLVDAVEGFERWSHSYDRAMGSMLAMAGEIAIAIADALEAELLGGERSRLSNRGTESREAYDLYLRGLNLHWMTPYSVENQFRGLEYFRAAIDADSTFAPAWALLADTYNGLGNFMVVAPGEAYPLAEEAALRAIALDDELAAGHTALGWTKLSYTFDWAGAEEEFRRTIDLAPSEFTGYHGLNFTLAVRGDFEEALAAAEEALSLDPLALWPRVGLAELRYKMGDFEAMLSESEAYLELQADDPFFLVLLAAAQAHTGAFAEAVVSAAKAEAVAQGDPTILLMAANAYAVAGDTATARERLGRMRILAEGGAMPVSAGLMALTYATLGELDEAFDWLGRGVETFESVGFIIYFPEFLPLRGDPRFGELLDRLGLPRAAYR
jgi:tetratricopeptide (TPR) repeat protein